MGGIKIINEDIDDRVRQLSTVWYETPYSIKIKKLLDHIPEDLIRQGKNKMFGLLSNVQESMISQIKIKFPVDY